LSPALCYSAVSCQNTTDLYSLFSLRIRPPPTPTLFPYTTLFRSRTGADARLTNELPEGEVAWLRERAPAWSVGTLMRSQATSPSDRKSTRLNSSHGSISYAVFCLKKKKKQNKHHLCTLSTIKYKD